MRVIASSARPATISTYVAPAGAGTLLPSALFLSQLNHSSVITQPHGAMQRSWTFIIHLLHHTKSCSPIPPSLPHCPLSYIHSSSMFPHSSIPPTLPTVIHTLFIHVPPFLHLSHTAPCRYMHSSSIIHSYTSVLILLLHAPAEVSVCIYQYRSMQSWYLGSIGSPSSWKFKQLR